MARATQPAYSVGKRFSWVGMGSIVVLGFLFYTLIQKGQWTAMYLVATIGCALFFVVVALDLGIKPRGTKENEDRES